MSTCMVSCNLPTSNIITLPRRSQIFSAHSSIRGHDLDGSLCSSRWCLKYDRNNRITMKHLIESKRNRNRNAVVCCLPPDAVQGGTPFGLPFPDGWQGWLVGAAASIGLPFLTNKWGPLVGWIDKIKATLQTAENIAEAVEDMAEKVDKMAEDLAGDLPEGKLKKAVTFVEHAAEEIAKDADRIDNLIDKVQEMEEKVEAMIEEGKDVAQEIKAAKKT